MPLAPVRRAAFSGHVAAIQLTDRDRNMAMGPTLFAPQTDKQKNETQDGVILDGPPKTVLTSQVVPLFGTGRPLQQVKESVLKPDLARLPIVGERRRMVSGWWVVPSVVLGAALWVFY
jgi:hypothetical protein